MSSFYDLASLVMIPSGKKAGKVYSQKPLTTDGQLDFTRASTATRIGSDGKIEKTRTNLLLQSNSFDSGTWGKSEVSLTSGQSGYDGTNDAWLLNVTSGTGSQRIYQSSVSSGVSTYSVYVKAGTTDWVALRLTGSPTSYLVWFNLSNGTKGTNQNAIDYTITSVGSGWYRCTLTGNTTSNNAFIYPATNDDLAGLNCVSGDNIYIQDTQRELGLVATNVITTTTAAVSVGSVDNMPRLNYTFNSATSCPSLLLEPQRTNLETKSEYFEGWSLVSNVTRTTNYTTSPDGTQNASRLQFTANGFLGNTTLSSGTEYTLSCYAKRNDSGSQSFGFFKDGSGAVNSEMTLTSDWKRFTYTYTAGNSSFAGLAASSGADVSVFGYQIEAASYATSYIPTFGATVTRVADATLKTGVSGLIGQTAGAFIFDYTPNFTSRDTGDDFIPFVISDGTTQNYFLLNDYNDELKLSVKAGNTTQASISAGTLSDNVRYKVGIAYAENDVVLYLNGVLKGSDTSATIPATSKIQLNGFTSTVHIGSFEAEKVLFFKTRLTNDQLAELTSLDS